MEPVMAQARRAVAARGHLSDHAAPGRATVAVALDRALAYAKAGLADRALAVLGKALGDTRANEVAAFTTGFVLLHGGHPRRALAWLERATELRPAYPQAWAARAEALRALGRLDEALDCCARGLALCPADAGLLAERGFTLHALGRLGEALLAHDDALAAFPGHVATLIDRALLLETLGRLDEALAGLDAALRHDPLRAEAWCNRGNVLQKRGDWPRALASYDAALSARADFPEALINRAAALRALGRLSEADHDAATALKLRPRSPDAWINRAIILQELGQEAEATTCYRKAVALRPLIPVPAIRSPAAFTALFVMAPGAGNTPPESLVGAAEHEGRILVHLPGRAPDERLFADADVVVNLVSDVDKSRPALVELTPLLARLGKPIVNPPELILRTDRQSVARTLNGIPHGVVPRTRRHAGGSLREAARDMAFPCLARPVGTHGGDDFERIEDAAALAAFGALHPGSDFYLTPFVDYRSPDGHFRKYRMMWIGGAVLPYHLAIGSHWKVHHASTDMASHRWMQEEEHRFLEAPGEVFDASAHAALQAIGERIGLDYFGIDCALDQEGRVVVFEVNASMLVHQRNSAFPYKAAAVARIKLAFDAMLARKASASG
jgi:tetratricopeptide (TPR) repeat protein